MRSASPAAMPPEQVPRMSSRIATRCSDAGRPTKIEKQSAPAAHPAVVVGSVGRELRNAEHQHAEHRRGIAEPRAAPVEPPEPLPAVEQPARQRVGEKRVRRHVLIVPVQASDFLRRQAAAPRIRAT
jgi:hypothetical protein